MQNNKSQHELNHPTMVHNENSTSHFNFFLFSPCSHVIFHDNSAKPNLKFSKYLNGPKIGFLRKKKILE